MPQLAKGGKWVYGWAVVGPGGEVTIPPEAQRGYGFRAGDEVILLPTSRRSGGFGISTLGLLVGDAERLGAEERVLGQGWIGADERVTVPPEVGVWPGDRLLAVPGSRYALSFLARGPIYEEALKHLELEVFE